MKVILIDNYDSFTFNLAQYLKEQENVELTIIQNDRLDWNALDHADKLVISPGPGLPTSNGMIVDIIRHYSGNKPILGVCLGLQAIYEAFGGRLFNMQIVHHGVSSTVFVTEPADLLYKGISVSFLAGRYHSWVCDPDTLPNVLSITAKDQEGSIMSCTHRFHPTYGVQFHPESILTPEGKKIISNFVQL